MPEPKEPKEPVKIVDRRSFTSEGERRQPEAEAGASRQEPAPGRTILGEGFEVRRGDQPAAEGPLEAVQFSSFVISLATTAFIQLGEMEDPVTSRKETNLDGARQMIDIIDMLRQKTRGNLDPAEKELIEGILFELKLRYTEKASAARS
ncbi:MAG TPA: DUF1844 domain-containing protein [Candidatus Polarisedimenticolia bacterium]|jgi:hypothetical protein